MSAAPSFVSAIPPIDSRTGFNLLSIPISTGTSALAGRMFGIISPVGGAIFGAASAITHTLTGLILPETDENTSIAIRIAKIAIQTFSALAAGVAVTTAFGYPITALAAIQLHMAGGAILCVSLLAFTALVGAGIFCAKASGCCNR